MIANEKKPFKLPKHCDGSFCIIIFCQKCATTNQAKKIFDETFGISIKKMKKISEAKNESRFLEQLSDHLSLYFACLDRRS